MSFAYNPFTDNLDYKASGSGGGTVTDVTGTANRITSTGGATPQIDIASTYIGQNSITTVGQVTTGIWNSPQQPCVCAYVNTTVPNVTGDGTVHVVVCDTTFVNIGSCYDTTTGIFTAPITGKYQYNVSVALQGVTAANTSGYVLCMVGGGGRQLTLENIGATYDIINGVGVISQSNIVFLSAGIQMWFNVAVFNGTKTVNLFGIGGAGTTTVFSCALLS